MQFIILFLTFFLGLDLTKDLFFSGFQTENFCVVLNFSVNFSCPNRPTLFQFTTHHHSLPSTNHAAPHCSVLFIPLLLPLSSKQISSSIPDLTQYFRVYSLEHKHKHTSSNTILCNRRCFFTKTSRCVKYVIFLNRSIECRVNNIETCNVCTYALWHNS